MLTALYYIKLLEQYDFVGYVKLTLYVTVNMHTDLFLGKFYKSKRCKIKYSFCILPRWYLIPGWPGEAKNKILNHTQ